MLGVGFKVSDTAPAAVRRALAERFSRDYVAPDSDPALDKFQQLKADADLVRSASPTSLRVLLAYLAQLERLATRLGESTTLGVQFTWNDSFCPRKKLSHDALAFEMAGVAFNAGALASQLGVACDRSDAEGLKTACRHFMRAAGFFAYVRDELAPKCLTGARPSPDASPEGLALLASLMLAQAQACFYEKAIKDGMKDAVKAKLVHQALEYYQAAYDMTQSLALAGVIDRMWGVHLQFQVHCMKAATQFWQAKAAKEAALARGTGYGEEIARLALADVECAEAAKVATQNKLPPALAQSARALQRVVQETLATARKDNASIYLDNVPKPSELPPVGKAAMVRPLPPTPDELAAELPGGQDLFEKFVPAGLLQRAAQAKDDVGALLAAARDKVATTNDAAKDKLHAMGLPAAIEAFERTSDNGIPSSSWQRIERVQSEHRGGAAAVAMQQQLRANDEASVRAEKQLRAVENRLSAEEVEDNVCRQNYGARWSRPASASLNDGFRLDIDRYYRLVKEAKESDKVVATKIETNHALLELLAQSKSQLDAQLPQLSSDTSSCRDEITAVSKLLLQLSGLMEEKAQVLADFAASHDKFNVMPILQRGAADETVDHAIADEKKFFEDHFVAKVDAICAEETALLAELADANTKFEAKKASDHVMLERQAFVQKLSDAVDTYEQLQSHLKEGAKFYEELSTRIGQLQQTVDDHCAARDLERRELELHVQADDAVRQREAHDAAVAAQMMRDMQLRDDSNTLRAVNNDEAFARQLAGNVPQQFQATAASQSAPVQSHSGLYASFPPQQPSPSFDYARLQQQQQARGGATAPGMSPPPQHPYTAYQQAQTNTSAPPNQPPPSYSSIFSSSPSSTPQFGNYYYAQQQQQPAYAPQQNHGNSNNSYYQYPGAAYQPGQTSNYPRPPGGSV